MLSVVLAMGANPTSDWASKCALTRANLGLYLDIGREEENRTILKDVQLIGAPIVHGLDFGLILYTGYLKCLINTRGVFCQF